MTTPIRKALRNASTLQPHVRDGLGAVKGKDLAYLERSLRSVFDDSLELDAALQKGREQENRWDYLLGYGTAGTVVGLEPHSATNHEVSVVIKKRKAALRQLGPHLNPNARVAAWFWVASGRVDLVPYEKKKLQLDQEGITFIGKALQKKHLP
ncbi:MAG TPA: hypothetical protein VFS00_32945 [Polyangiaceae bacterium]|nr:hypothetical protein [Polyangiaceae bacterium]